MSSINNKTNSIPMKWKPTSDLIPIGCEAMDLNDIRDLVKGKKKISQLSIPKMLEYRIEERSLHSLEVKIFYGIKSSQDTKQKF